MGPQPLEIFLFFQHGDCLYTAESDVYRHQILTYKDILRAEKIKCDPYFLTTDLSGARWRWLKDSSLHLAGQGTVHG